MAGGVPSITCRVCHRTSHHPIDVEEGYCGFCHDWTAMYFDRQGRPVSEWAKEFEAERQVAEEARAGHQEAVALVRAELDVRSGAEGRQ